MFAILTALLTFDATAATLEVDLKDLTASISTPGANAVELILKSGAEGETTTWDNGSSSAVSFKCGDEGTAPEDQFVDQLILAVGEKKWGLAPGSNVNFKCPAGKAVTAMDIHSESVGTFKGPLLVTVNKSKPHSAR